MQSNNKKVQQYTTVQKTQERDNSMEVILSCKKTNIRRRDRNTLLYKKNTRQENLIIKNGMYRSGQVKIIYTSQVQQVTVLPKQQNYQDHIR